MSNALAIAAVTATLRNLLDRGVRDELEGGLVTAQPPDKARQNRDSSNQINLFLYQTMPSAAWRNRDLPNRVKPGETGQPPLALNLYYLLTAYGKNDDDFIGHRLLGTAMQILHDRAILDSDDIKQALAESDLHHQIERVRLTLQPLSLDELSKLWATFQTQYRISATYEISVVLIDSARPVKSPLPVLTRGERDRGIEAQANLIPPFPRLESLELPRQQTSLRLGEVLTLRGDRLEGSSVVLIKHPRWSSSLQLSPLPGANATTLMVEFPDRAGEFPSGFYTVMVQVERQTKTQTTNLLGVSLAPQIRTVNLAGRQLTIECHPQIWVGQTVSLLIGDRELVPQGIDAAVERFDQLEFDIGDLPTGTYWIRLRVDGVDSLLVDRSGTLPVFDPTQQITI